MTAQIMDGKALALLRRQALKERVNRLKERGVVPRLDVIVASQDPASVAYVKMKFKAAEAVGITGESYMVDSETSQAQLIDQIHAMNQNPAIHGILLQHPLPKHLDESDALIALGAEKDVDGITPQSLGRLVANLSGFRSATPLGIMRLLSHYKVDIAGKHALVIGRSVILGKPMSLLLLEANATVTIAHSKTKDLPELSRTADLLVAAVGRPELVQGEWIKPGAVVIDAGYNRVEGRSGDVGDVHFESAKEIASMISPVPGGVGPMTVATLLENAVDAAEACLH